ncbi:hypothetical protein [Stenomitos frigidus]|uniref:hypothetical protein n=1 Tax=Stenomitos frigidus TaxID=1886765 RepID=UPI0015E7596C|nr:hypothetical protein [Stenomitos frigidus]
MQLISSQSCQPSAFSIKHLQFHDVHLLSDTAIAIDYEWVPRSFCIACGQST